MPKPANPPSPPTPPTKGNFAPVADDEHFVVQEDNGMFISLADLLAGDTDRNKDDTLSIISVQNEVNGQVLLGNGPTLRWGPDQNFFGTASFEYTVSDGKGGFDTGLVTITVTPVNDAPVVSGPVTLEAIPQLSGVRHITQAELLANARDVDSASLTATALTIAAGGGTLRDNGNGTWDYTPPPNDDTAVSFSYTVSDGSLTTQGTATLDIGLVNYVRDNPDVYFEGLEGQAGEKDIFIFDWTRMNIPAGESFAVVEYLQGFEFGVDLITLVSQTGVGGIGSGSISSALGINDPAIGDMLVSFSLPGLATGGQIVVVDVPYTPHGQTSMATWYSYDPFAGVG